MATDSDLSSSFGVISRGMSEQVSKIWVGGIYNWASSSTKEIRRLGNYPRHNWCDIDIYENERLESVLEVFKKHQIDVVSQQLGKGWHVFGDIVAYETWKQVWLEIKPYADPLWAPHTLRLTKKRTDEVYERPIYHKNKNDPPNWSRSLMHFLCKAIRDENSSNIWSAMHDTGLDKYFQCTVYSVGLR